MILRATTCPRCIDAMKLDPSKRCGRHTRSNAPAHLAEYRAVLTSGQGDEVMRRARVLFGRTPRAADSRSYATCPVCNEQQRVAQLYGHLQYRHAKRVMGMPASDFE